MSRASWRPDPWLCAALLVAATVLLPVAVLGWAALRDALVRTDTLGRDASATIAATASAPHTTTSNPAPDSQEIS